jgi:GNAT superfamily N-acetyltransferase
MTNKSIHIRNARESEFCTIQDLVTISYKEFEAVVSPTFWASYQKLIAATLKESWLSAEYIVAIQNETLVGSVLLFPPATPSTYPGKTVNVSLPEFRLLTVSPKMRGQGIATALINECIQRTHRSGALALGLYTADFMQAATHLYQQIGFMRCPEEDFPLDDPWGTIAKSYHLPLK